MALREYDGGASERLVTKIMNRAKGTVMESDCTLLRQLVLRITASPAGAAAETVTGSAMSGVGRRGQIAFWFSRQSKTTGQPAPMIAAAHRCSHRH